MPKLKPSTQHAAELFLALVGKDYDVLGGIVYGSQARGQERPDSDTDMAVLLRGPHATLYDTTMRLSDSSFDVMLDTGVCIQAIPIWEDWWHDPQTFNNPDLIKNIKREGIRV
jgi:predicted nucleotidyltransferase